MKKNQQSDANMQAQETLKLKEIHRFEKQVTKGWKSDFEWRTRGFIVKDLSPLFSGKMELLLHHFNDYFIEQKIYANSLYKYLYIYIKDLYKNQTFDIDKQKMRFTWQGITDNLNAKNKFFKGQKMAEVPEYFKPLYDIIKRGQIKDVFLRIAITVDEQRRYHIFGIYENERQLQQLHKIIKQIRF